MLWCEAGVGAVASQAMGEPRLGHVGLEMMSAGSTPAQVIAALTAGDTRPGVRQIGIIDLTSEPAAYTGGDCVAHAEHRAGRDCVAQANVMTSPGVPEAMVKAFEGANEDLSDRLLTALDAAQAMGGDFRGMQSAGLVVRVDDRGSPSWRTAVVNVRVDDDPQPLHELRRLAELSKAYGQSNVPLERLSAGDVPGALDEARSLSPILGGDPNFRLRLALTLTAAGDPEGSQVLAALVEQSDRWLAYARGLCRRHDIDPDPLLAGLE